MPSARLLLAAVTLLVDLIVAQAGWAQGTGRAFLNPTSTGAVRTAPGAVQYRGAEPGMHNMSWCRASKDSLHTSAQRSLLAYSCKLTRDCPTTQLCINAQCTCPSGAGTLTLLVAPQHTVTQTCQTSRIGNACIVQYVNVPLLSRSITPGKHTACTG